MRWLGAVEGYYGPPLAPEARLDLVRWMGEHGFNCYAYAPKDDPFHRARWREPYDTEQMARFEELLEVGRQSGVEVALVVSPGLDWRGDDDIPRLAAKLASFRDLGANVLGVAWDDVPPGGAELGERHGRAVAHAVHEVGAGVRWLTCPTDYSGTEATPYLRAYADALPEGVEIMWTGPGIVSPSVHATDARRLGEALGRKLLFAENYPVNDGAMAGVLHLGPYPAHDPHLPDEVTGVFCNLMSLPLASRVGLDAAARWWNDPTGDRITQWRAVVDGVAGLGPLAQASRSRVGDAGPDAELRALVDAAVAGDTEPLRRYCFAGCRNGLAPAWVAELEPWLQQWDFETQAMQYALLLIDARPSRPASTAFVLSELWSRARASKLQLFGIRWAFYPVTAGAGATIDATPHALVEGSNLTDELCRAAVLRS